MQLRHYFLPLIALLVFGQRGDRDPMWAQLIPLSAIAALVLVSVLQYLSYRYRIGSDAITVRSGLLARNQPAAPPVRRGRAAPGVGRWHATGGGNAGAEAGPGLGPGAAGAPARAGATSQRSGCRGRHRRHRQ
ncbi:hypothetical protein G6F22_015858 [Rhizopus arrhizus]|nr:hypothetical protein G6F22_015858 [Rhizopus arrhizus]